MEIQVMNRQRRVRLDLSWLRRFAARALEECVDHSGDGVFALKKMPCVEVAIVSDAVIAKVHQDFMGIAGATDVITFEHGEIVTSADTARAAAAEHGHRTEEEVALYIVHGLLHLNGYDDTTAKAKAAMFRVQGRVWERLREELLQ